MGYKRMKKKEIRVDKKFREWNKILAKMGFRNLGIVRLGPQVKPKSNDNERMKWFESPNAEGYLDM